MEDRNDAWPSPINDSASEATDRVADSTQTAVDTAKSSASEIAGTVKDAARDVVSAVKDRAMSQASDLHSSAADQAKTAATTLRKSADGLEDELPWMRTALNKTADGIEQLTSALNRGDINETLSHVSEFARRQPALFMGLSVAAGFALARIGKTAIENAVPADTTTPKANGAADGVYPANAGI
jgi:uncharacterized phage infection (PIP) family protein YhgE